MAFAPSEDTDQPGHLPSLISLCCPHEEKLYPQVPIECTAKTDQTQPGTQADLSLRFAHMPFYRFCHVLSHIRGAT